jgi:hypothetical protein
MANSNYPNHTVLTHDLQTHLRGRNAHARQVAAVFGHDFSGSRYSALAVVGYGWFTFTSNGLPLGSNGKWAAG